MALEDYCAACTYLGEKADYNGKYYCSRKGEDHYASDPKCYSYCEAYNRSNSARKNMYENSKSHSGGGCYITTAMCNILGFNDNSYYLQTLRIYRNTVLKTNVNNWPLLITYDTIGPIIADYLSNDKNKEEIAYTLFNTFIVNAVHAIEEKKYEEAKNIYIAMTNSLAEKYGININEIDLNKENIDIKTLGHARIRKKAF